MWLLYWAIFRFTSSVPTWAINWNFAPYKKENSYEGHKRSSAAMTNFNS